EELASKPAGLLVHPVDEPQRFGIAFLKADGTLEKLVEKPALTGTQLANTGAYVFPANVFEHELKESARGEYEITDYVTALAKAGTVHAVRTRFWLPIGTVEAWQAAQGPGRGGGPAGGGRGRDGGAPARPAQKKRRGGVPREDDPRHSVRCLWLLPSRPDQVRNFPLGGSPPGISPRAVTGVRHAGWDAFDFISRWRGRSFPAPSPCG